MFAENPANPKDADPKKPVARHAETTVRGEVLKVQAAELSVSILVDGGNSIVYLTSGDDKKGDATFRINDKTTVLHGDGIERMKFEQIHVGNQIAIELDKTGHTVQQIRVLAKMQITAQPSAATMVIHQRQFRIPVQLEPSQRNQTKRVSLRYSTDGGDTWTLGETLLTEELSRGFSFTANRDGGYWFSVMIEDKNGRFTPDPESGEPCRAHLKVRVDTSNEK